MVGAGSQHQWLQDAGGVAETYMGARLHAGSGGKSPELEHRAGTRLGCGAQSDEAGATAAGEAGQRGSRARWWVLRARVLSVDACTGETSIG